MFFNFVYKILLLVFELCALYFNFLIFILVIKTFLFYTSSTQSFTDWETIILPKNPCYPSILQKKDIFINTVLNTNNDLQHTFGFYTVLLN